MRNSLLFRILFFCVLCGIAPPASPAGGAVADAEAAVSAARALKLGQAHYWRALLHYDPGAMGERSLVDDPDFFLSESGKRDPDAELAATLRGFYRPPSNTEAGPEGARGADAHPICRFPARYDWLRGQLAPAGIRPPEMACPEYAEYLARLDPRSATLIFPTYYINSPASMFGHTLLAIGSGRKSDLLAQAAVYSARTDETNGLLFATRGLFGLYDGYYALDPYYEKIAQYNDMAQRDIWEYRLSLTPEEVRRMAAHLWELRGIHSRYYFFDENCSSNLLFLLNAARPSAGLTGQFAPWTLPVDVIMAVKAADMVTDVAYRPSLATRIRHGANRLAPAERRTALALARGEMAPETDSEAVRETSIGATATGETATGETSTGETSTGETSTGETADLGKRIAVLDLAALYLRYLYAEKALDKDAYATRLHGLLVERGRRGPAAAGMAPEMSGKMTSEPAPPPRPDAIHDPARLLLAAGADGDGAFAQIAIRAAFGDLMDTEYLPDHGMKIVFGDAVLRYRPETGSLRLWRLDLIDILSLAPRDDLFRPTSWRVRAGLIRRPGPDEDAALLGEIVTGGGLTWRLPRLGLAYVLAEPRLEVGGGLPEGVGLGAGLSAGLLARFSHRWRGHVSASGAWLFPGDDYLRTAAALSVTRQMGRNHTVGLDISWERAFDKNRLETLLSWRIFF